MKWVLSFLLLALPAMGGREFVAASSEYGGKSSSSITGYPFTIAAWVYPYSTNSSRVIAGLFSGDGSATASRSIIFVRDGVARLDVGPIGVSTTARLELNKWQHVAGVFASSSSRTIYLNGTNSVNGTASQTILTMDKIGVGARINATWGLFWDGVLAEVAFWNVALTADEILSLASSANPLSIRPASLRHHLPLTGLASGSEIDFVGSALGLTNTPAASALHPRIYKP